MCSSSGSGSAAEPVELLKFCRSTGDELEDAVQAGGASVLLLPSCHLPVEVRKLYVKCAEAQSLVAFKRTFIETQYHTMVSSNQASGMMKDDVRIEDCGNNVGQQGRSPENTELIAATH